MQHTPRKLTDRQRRFIEEYLVDLNAVQAAIRAGYAEKSAHENAFRILRRPGVTKAVQAAMESRAARTRITQDRVLEELAAVAFFDPAEIASVPLSGPEDFCRLPKHARGAIAGWGWNPRGDFMVKLVPKTPALIALAKHLGLFLDIKTVEAPEQPTLASEPLAATARWLDELLDNDIPDSETLDSETASKSLKPLPRKTPTA